MVHERPVGEWARLRTTTLGPAAQRPLPRKGSEVAGSRRAGPAPQMKALAWRDEKNIDVRMSPIPNRGSNDPSRPIRVLGSLIEIVLPDGSLGQSWDQMGWAVSST
jgi:hypothetical protein